MAILQPTFHCTHTCLFHWFPVSSPSRYRLANIQKASQKNFVVSHLDFVSSDYQQVSNHASQGGCVCQYATGACYLASRQSTSQDSSRSHSVHRESPRVETGACHRASQK